ncbi:hypothetical protein ASPWEDRAFT_34835 [Aspergillus wentii DTO 134E9]|uniref:Thioredoxin domain-containing protein n=1 Tax=Aspergillus wentii DTO 134E9 TaxID=1073089 RepID=A0A1L9S2E0_ASPWE|nr:uncharacterized protein ASPWEDRAFT_34835 [Aspergillus wentii DTO 134E9]KAI9924363.1 hypothetical protein MW887_006989 [Aspergillus wentii]OJJ41315.1 hypothetical protein ASPWEDRAFT_34835 [Aspergillus wentii DTO 134E9]
MNRDHEHRNRTRDQDDDSDSDALFEALENEDDSAYRAQRIEQLNAEFSSAKTNRDPSSSAGPTLVNNDSLYPTLSSDQALLDFTTQTHRCVVHFAHPDFARCTVMDEHLQALAARHYEVRFARVDVRHTPFVVEKLSIRVLPCVIGFKDGLGIERVLGFEGLGSGGEDGTEGFNTTTLEKRLLHKGILAKSKIKADDQGSDDDSGSDDDGGKRRNNPRRGAIRSGNKRDDNDDDDWE